MSTRMHKPQRGAATLAIVMALLLVMGLTAASLQRGLVFEHRAAAHQLRATQAQEAAEAGLEWALASLNGPRIDTQCRPSADGQALRERVLSLIDAREGRFVPGFDATRNGAPGCVRADGGWQCRCPAQGHAELPAVSGDALHPAFRVEFGGAEPAATALRGLIQLTAHGCAHGGANGACSDAAGAEPGHAVARVQAALLPALAALPAAPLTATGDVDFSGAAVGLHNADARTGLLVQAGGVLQIDDAHLSPPPGTPGDAALVERDARLAAQTQDSLFKRYLGMPRSAFEHLPGVHTLHCSDDCTSALQQAVRAGRRMLWVTGDLSLRDATLGSAPEPLLLVADGDIRLGAGVRFTGFLFGRSLQWQAGGGNDWLRGAAVLAGPVGASGAPDLVRDAEVLHTLHTLTGTYVRVPGSWKDTL
ncbi:MAG: hypothetical protein AB1430_15055 [Pseudomonadota bacterium]